MYFRELMAQIILEAPLDQLKESRYETQNFASYL